MLYLIRPLSPRTSARKRLALRLRKARRYDIALVHNLNISKGIFCDKQLSTRNDKHTSSHVSLINPVVYDNMSCPLLRCPSEIIEGIISFLNEHSDLRSFASTCSKLQPLTEAALYHTVFHRTGDAAVQLVETIEALPARAKYIQIIDSRCKWQKRMGLKSLASVIEQATNLRELTIESPYCKYAYGKEAAEWRETMYALLRPICLEGCFPILRDCKCSFLVNVTEG